MIKKLFTSVLFFMILSCSNIEFVLNENDSLNILKNKVLVVVTGKDNEKYAQELYSYLGSNKDGEYILITSFFEKKENRAVKKNQMAEKIDYELSISYDLFYKSKECKILNKKVITRFTTSPQSSGYNFGADRSLKKLYTSSINNNINRFIQSVPTSTDCLS